MSKLKSSIRFAFTFRNILYHLPTTQINKLALTSASGLHLNMELKLLAGNETLFIG